MNVIFVEISSVDYMHPVRGCGIVDWVFCYADVIFVVGQFSFLHASL